MPPGFLAWARVALGALVLLPLVWRADLLGSLRGRARWLIFYAVVEIAIPFPLIAFGEQHASSSVAALTIAAIVLTPLAAAAPPEGVALFAGAIVLSESPGLGALIGLPLIIGGSYLATGRS